MAPEIAGMEEGGCDKAGRVDVHGDSSAQLSSDAERERCPASAVFPRSFPAEDRDPAQPGRFRASRPFASRDQRCRVAARLRLRLRGRLCGRASMEPGRTRRSTCWGVGSHTGGRRDGAWPKPPWAWAPRVCGKGCIVKWLLKWGLYSFHLSKCLSFVVYCFSFLFLIRPAGGASQGQWRYSFVKQRCGQGSKLTAWC